MNPVALSIGPVTVHWYGLLIVGGAVLAAYIATIEARRRGEDPEHVWNLLVWVLIFGIIGARLYHVFSSPVGGVGWSYYREHPLDIINFWSGGFRGLGIYGAIAGGFLAMAVYCWRNKLILSQWLDIVTPGLLLAQAIGRLGNRINQELYGPPTTLPWAFRINPTYPCQEPAGSPLACGLPDRLTDAARQWYAQNGFHPTFYYEGLWNLVGFGLLMWIGRRFQNRLRDGDIFLMYFIWYPLGRFWVEMLRPDAWISGFLGLTTAQVISVAAIVAAVIGLVLRHRNWTPEPEVPAGQSEVELPGETQA